MAKMPWLKLHTEIRTDPKMQALTDTQFRIWINLLCLSAEGKVRGSVCIDEDLGYPEEALAKVLFVDQETLSAALSVFQKLRMIDVDENGVIILRNFVKRQYDNPSDHPQEVAERVRRHRQSKKNADETNAKRQCNDNVTTMKRDCNDTDKEEDKEKDNNTSPNGDGDAPIADDDAVSIKPRKKSVAQYSADAKKIANALKERLKEKGVILPRDWHLKSYATADKLLAEGISKDLMLECIEWSTADPFYSKQVDSMSSIERLLPKYQLQSPKQTGPPNDDLTPEERMRKAWDLPAHYEIIR